jgi:hypothetical protein
MSFDLEEDPSDEPLPPGPLPPATPKTVGRTLPHSLEAEEYLLSCVLLDGNDVLTRCEDMRISSGDFYDPKHGVIYACAWDIFRRGLPVSIDVVAEELKTSRQIDQVGGYGFLAQVSSRIPTTAQAGYFIDKVKELSLLREIIRSATTAVEDCYGFTGDIESFAAGVRDRMERATEESSSALRELTAKKYNPDEPIEEEKVVFRLNGIPIFTPGNISALVAPPGVGKSADIGALIAASVSTPTDEVDCLGYEGPNYEGLPLLHFDTEQSKRDYQLLLERSWRRAGVDRPPEWFHSFHLTGEEPSKCRGLVETAIRYFARKHGRLFAVIIDGWADLVVDPNDTAECFPFVARMHMFAIKTKSPIIGVLHLNPGSESKSRGHLGSQLERKAETVLQLQMDENLVTAVWASKKRGAPIRKDDGPRFQWSKDHGMHVLVPDWKERAATARAEKRAAKEAARPTAYKEVYSREEQVSFYPASNQPPESRPQIMRKAQEVTKISDRSFQRMRLDFLQCRWIEEINGQFRRTREGDDWARRKPGAQAQQPQGDIDF